MQFQAYGIAQGPSDYSPVAQRNGNAGNVPTTQYGISQGPGEYTPTRGEGSTHGARRRRTHFTPEQLAILEREFERSRNPKEAERKQLAIQLGISEVSVTVWFQNRRARQVKASLAAAGQSASASVQAVASGALPTSNPPLALPSTESLADGSGSTGSPEPASFSFSDGVPYGGSGQAGGSSVTSSAPNTPAPESASAPAPASAPASTSSAATADRQAAVLAQLQQHEQYTTLVVKGLHGFLDSHLQRCSNMLSEMKQGLQLNHQQTIQQTETFQRNAQQQHQELSEAIEKVLRNLEGSANSASLAPLHATSYQSA